MAYQKREEEATMRTMYRVELAANHAGFQRLGTVEGFNSLWIKFACEICQTPRKAAMWVPHKLQSCVCRKSGIYDGCENIGGAYSRSGAAEIPTDGTYTEVGRMYATDIMPLTFAPAHYSWMATDLNGQKSDVTIVIDEGEAPAVSDALGTFRIRLFVRFAKVH